MLSGEFSRNHAAGRRPTRRGNRPTRVEKRPTRAGNRPTPAGRRPTRRGNRPTRVEKRPTRAGNRPTRLGKRPTRLGKRPTRVGSRPTRAGNRPTLVGKRPTRPETARKGSKTRFWGFCGRGRRYGRRRGANSGPPGRSGAGRPADGCSRRQVFLSVRGGIIRAPTTPAHPAVRRSSLAAWRPYAACRCGRRDLEPWSTARASR